MLENSLYFNTNTLARKLNAVWEQAFEDYELSPTHAFLLRMILEAPGLEQQDLAKEMRLNQSTIDRYVATLEKKGLLDSQEATGRHDEKSVIPSKKALMIHEKLEKLGDELYLSMCEAVGKENLESFVKTARQINESL